MVLGTIFEMLGAITVGARTADTIKNGIIPNSAFRGDAGVQMLAFSEFRKSRWSLEKVSS